MDTITMVAIGSFIVAILSTMGWYSYKGKADWPKNSHFVKANSGSASSISAFLGKLALLSWATLGVTLYMIYKS